MAEMTAAQKDSAVKKINERYIQICREFGANSGLAKDYLHTMELVAGSENLQIIASTTTKKAPANNPDYETGEIKVHQIKRSKKTLESIDPDDLDALLQKHTAGQIKKSAKEEAKRQQEDSGKNVSIRDIIEDMDYIYDFLDEYGYDSKDNEDFSKMLTLYWNAAGPGAPRPSWSDLRMLREAQLRTNELRIFGNEAEADNIEDKLFKRIKAEKGRDIDTYVF